jgi:hypothetical protein
MDRAKARFKPLRIILAALFILGGAWLVRQVFRAEGCAGINVEVGRLSQAFVNSRPAGSTFCLQAGTHFLRTPIKLRKNDSVVGVGGAIVDGRATVIPAFYGFAGEDDNVTIRNLTLQRFRGTTTIPGGHRAIKTGGAWVLDNLTVKDNLAGVAVFAGSVVRNSRLVNNSVYGLNGSSATAENNEIAYNGGTQDSGGSTGGSKIVHSHRMFTFRDNYVHHNKGPGLWCDYNNLCLYEGNLVELNEHVGIFHEYNNEADDRGIIRNNTLRNNGTGLIEGEPAASKSLSWGGNLYVKESSNTEVYGNAVQMDEVPWHGIGVVDDSRSGPISNNHVYENVVIKPLTEGVAAGAIGGTLTAVSQARFENNSYSVPDTTTAWWRWGVGRTATAQDRTWVQWQAVPQDATGVLREARSERLLTRRHKLSSR